MESRAYGAWCPEEGPTPPGPSAPLARPGEPGATAGLSPADSVKALHVDLPSQAGRVSLGPLQASLLQTG